MNILKQIYNSMPLFMQTGMLNLYGIRNYIRMNVWNHYIKKKRDSEYWTNEKQIEYVSNKIRNILLHAVTSVPRYESLFKIKSDLTNPQSDIFSILAEFPIISKDEVLKNQSAFISKRPKALRIIHTVTSGTTGQPFSTRMSYSIFTLSDALWWRRNIWAGYRRGEWIARLVGDPIIPLKEKNPEKPWRISYIDKRIYLSSFHLNADTANKYLDILEKMRPEYLMGYPSSLEILAAFLIESNRKIIWIPKKIFFSSEPMYEHQRNIILKAFKSSIHGLYGSAERLISAAQCDEGNYHLSLLDGYVEGQFDTMTREGPALATTLMNFVMPLIRFQIGDIIKFRQGNKCACGRTLPIIEPVLTKQEDWILTPSGRRISSSILTFAFKELPGLRRSQIIQEKKDLLEIHLDADEKHFTNITQLLDKRLREMLFNEIKINFVRNTDLYTTSSGKTRFVVRKPSVLNGLPDGSTYPKT